MSAAAFEHSRESHKLCQSCHDRKARFRFRGVVKADRDHTLCFECFRSQRDRRRAEMLANVPPRPPLRAPLEAHAEPLTSPQAEHRRRMLEHLGGSARLRTDATGP